MVNGTEIMGRQSSSLTARNFGVDTANCIVKTDQPRFGLMVRGTGTGMVSGSPRRDTPDYANSPGASDFVLMVFLFMITAKMIFSLFLKMGILVDLSLI
jgi:hypothetical protein